MIRKNSRVQFAERTRGVSEDGPPARQTITADSAASSTLPDGWMVGWSPAYGRHYYANAALGISQWEPPPLPQQPAGVSPSVQRSQLPPIISKGKPKGKLDKRNVEAAMRERAVMRERDARQRALDEQSDYQLAIGLSRSLAEQRQHEERPGEAAAAAGAAALKRAQSADAVLPRSPARLQPLQSRHGLNQPPPSQQRAPLGAVGRAPRAHSAAFCAAVEERFSEWSTQMYASNSYLQEIGATARQEQRDRIRDELEREWRAAGLQDHIYEGGSLGSPVLGLGHGPGWRLNHS